ncbi:LysR family transcriptional regulator [Variovorax sp.]|uniref:LysR family transcriptional regulator n=1 Tax=Variovorax sp. TaxID=1871043 RepID=UPI002D747BBB|nr:LysR family transcriptional regulator [Variovorax sp.]HYP84407.1 LysR family transcriptional regulator [Variovorax sp.]
MTLVQLRHLVALADSGSFSRTAERLFISQPALSRSIRALESELGQALFDRVGRRSELTAAGRELLIRARQIVADADELQDTGRRMARGEAGVLRIGMGSGPGAVLMTPLLLEAAARHPGLRVDISRARTDLLVHALRERMLDALVVDARSLAPAPDLQVDSLREMRGTFMCRPEHPLAGRRRVRFDEVLRYPLASTPLSDEVVRVLVDRFGPAAHPDRCVSLRCEEIASLVEVTRRSDAVLLAIHAAGSGLVELDMDPPVNSTALFGVVTLARRAPAQGLSLVRQLMLSLMLDQHLA